MRRLRTSAHAAQQPARAQRRRGPGALARADRRGGSRSAAGAASARQFARHGIEVGIANTRGPESLAALTAELGDRVRALSLEQAVAADVVILAVPFRAHAAIARARPDWAGQIVVDAMNTYGVPLEELKGQASSEVVAAAFTGARVVKTFNQLPAKLLAKDPTENSGRRVMFVASNDEAASTLVTELVGSLGFAPIGFGRLNVGGALLGLGGPRVLQNLIKQR